MGLNKRLIDQVGGAAGVEDPTEHFGVATYAGSSNTQNISTNFEAGLTWFFHRTTGDDGIVKSDVLGNSGYVGIYYPYANNNNIYANPNPTYIQINSHPFINTANENHLMFYWYTGGTNVTNTDGTITSTVQADPVGGISTFKYTGNGTSGSTIGHGLGDAPAVVFVKNASDAGINWCVFNHNFGGNGFLQFDRDVNLASSGAMWGGTSPNGSVITLGDNSRTNQSGKNYFGFAFVEKEGFSKFGTYTGNGTASTSNPIQTTDFQPRFLMIKSTASGSPWYIFDSVRSTSNPRNRFMTTHNRSAEGVGSLSTDYVYFESTGFRVTTDAPAMNTNGQTYSYYAFA